HHCAPISRASGMSSRACSSSPFLIDMPAITKATAEPAANATKKPNHWITKSMGGFSLADHDFDTAILGLTVRAAVVGDRVGRTVTLRGQVITHDTLCDQVIGDGVGPVGAQ